MAVLWFLCADGGGSVSVRLCFQCVHDWRCRMACYRSADRSMSLMHFYTFFSTLADIPRLCRVASSTMAYFHFDCPFRCTHRRRSRRSSSKFYTYIPIAAYAYAYALHVPFSSPPRLSVVIIARSSVFGLFFLLAASHRDDFGRGRDVNIFDAFYVLKKGRNADADGFSFFRDVRF